jgi:hypothetical protein
MLVKRPGEAPLVCILEIELDVYRARLHVDVVRLAAVRRHAERKILAYVHRASAEVLHRILALPA